MNDCCLNHDSKYCPECGNKINYGDAVGHRVLALLNRRVAAAEKALVGLNLNEASSDYRARTLANAKTLAKWVSDRLEVEGAERRATVRQRQSGQERPV